VVRTSLQINVGFVEKKDGAPVLSNLEDLAQLGF
jgi:hypothetical protein